MQNPYLARPRDLHELSVLEAIVIHSLGSIVTFKNVFLFFLPEGKMSRIER